MKIKSPLSTSGFNPFDLAIILCGVINVLYRVAHDNRQTKSLFVAFASSRLWPYQITLLHLLRLRPANLEVHTQ